MVKLLTSGGFGDAAMSLAKIHAKFSDSLNEISLIHIRTRKDNLNSTIHEFYNTQEIDNKVITVPSWDWQKQNRNKFDFFLGCNWTAENHNDETSWEIEPFPKIKYSKIKSISTLLNPSSGGTEEVRKSFSKTEVDEFTEIDPSTIIIGRGDDGYDEYANSLYNKTDIRELVNLIASSETVITPEGFTAYFAAMCGKRVFVKSQNINAIIKRKHPLWKLTIIDSMKEIIRK